MQPFLSTLQPGLPRHDLPCALPLLLGGGSEAAAPQGLSGSLQFPLLPSAQYKTLRITVLSPPLPHAGKRQHCFFLSYDDISPCSPSLRRQHSLPFGEFQFQRSKREGRKEREQKERMNGSEGERERGRKRGEGRREDEQGKSSASCLCIFNLRHISVILIFTSLICHFDFQSNNLEYYTKLSPIPSPL